MTTWSVTFVHVKTDNFHARVVEAKDPDDAVPRAARVLMADLQFTQVEFGRHFRLYKVVPQEATKC